MNESEIREIFVDFHNEFKDYQDAGASELTFLSLYIKRMNENDRKQVLDYCLDESRILLSLDLLKNLDDNSIIDRLYSIFEKFNLDKMEEAGKVLSVLFKLKDSNPSHIELYSRFLNEEIEKKGLFWTDFHLNADYLFVNKEHSLKILSDYYCHLTENDASIISFLENRIVNIVYLFEETSFDYMKELIAKTSNKNKKAGEVLRRLFYNHAKSNFCKKKEEEMILSYLD